MNHSNRDSASIQHGTANDVDVSVDGSTKASSVSLDGRSETISLNEFETGSHSVSISGAGVVDYEASWDERRVPEDISVDTDEDGNAELVRQSPLPEGESISTTTELSPGSTTIAISNNGPTPSWGASFTEVTATDNIRADLNGDGNTDIDRSKPLRASQSVTRTVSMNPGSNTVSVDHSGPEPGWSGSVWETNATQNPTVTVKQESTTTEEILTEGETATLRISSLEAGENTIDLSTTDGPKPAWTIYYTANSTTKNPTVDVGGNGDIDATHSGAITSPTTVDLNGLSPGKNKVIAGSGSGPTPQVKVTFKNRTAAENPSASVGGEIVSHTGLLRQGETATFELSGVDKGDNTVSISTDAGRVDYTLSGDSVYLLEDPGLDYDDDELNDAGYQGTLDQGESVTIEAAGLQHGTQELDFNSEVNQIKYELSYTERNVTKTPSFDIGGATACKQPGITGDAQECDVPAANLSIGSNTLDLSTINGTVRYEFEYTAVTAPESATISVAGSTHQYPADFAGSGKLPDDPTREETKNISALSPGTHSVSISTGKVDGLDTAADVTVTFSNRSYQSENPTIAVTDSEGVQRSKTVPDTALSADGHLTGTYRMQIQSEWLTEGQNTIHVQPPGKTTVNATVRGTGLVNQTRQFQEG